VKKDFFFLYCIILNLFPNLLIADDLSGQGEVRVEIRNFLEDQLDDTIDRNLSVFTRFETTYDVGPFKHVLRGFGRVDGHDDDRSIIALEDAYFSYSLDEDGEYVLLGGYKTFNWSTTEFFHPVDVINSKNFDSDLDNQEKKGELTLEFEISFFDGVINVFYFPKFEEPNYPGPNSRIGGGYQIERAVTINGEDTTSSQYLTPQYGARVTQTVADADLSLHYLNHIDRNFPIIGTNDYINSGAGYIATTSEVVPFYYKVQQVGGTYQQVLSDWILKFEYVNRSFDVSDVEVLSIKSILAGSAKLQRPADHSEVAIGIDYLFHIFKKCELNVFAEAASILNTDEEARAELSLFQRDVMVGARLAINDVMGREFSFNLVKDLERKNETIINFSYNQRVTDNIKLNSGIRYISAPQKISLYKEGLEAFDEDGYAYFHLTRFF
jgi:hypothetical protein